MSGYIEILPSKDGKYYWRKRAGNHEITATSGQETYEHPTDCKSAAIREFGDEIPVRVIYRPKKDDEGGD